MLLPVTVIAFSLAIQSADERLFAAIEAGNVAFVQEALNDGASLKALNAEFIDLLPLAFAAWEDQLEVVEALLDSGAKVNARNPRGTTALMCARSGPLVARLLEAGAEVNLTDGSGRNALFEVVEFAESEAVKLLLDAGAEPNVQDPDSEETVLMRAAENREDGAEIVVMLLAAGAEMNADGLSGTALSRALSRGSLATVRALIDAGARMEIPNWFPPLEAAASSTTDGFEKVEVLLEAGVVLDLSNRELANELVLGAARSGDAELLRLLVEAGADPNATRIVRSVRRSEPDEHFPAIFYATNSASTEALQVLIESKADVDAATLPAKETPLRYAAEYGAVEHVRALLMADATVDAPDAEGVTALMAAAQYHPRFMFGEPEQPDFTETLQLLINAGADVNAKSKHGMTPLTAAVGSNKLAHVALLLEAGADPLFHAPTGHSLMELLQLLDANKDLDPAIVQLLEEALENR